MTKTLLLSLSVLAWMLMTTCKARKSDLKVVGGKVSPYGVLNAVRPIAVGDFAICTGSFLSQTVMLTASHCVVHGTETGMVSIRGIKSLRYWADPTGPSPDKRDIDDSKIKKDSAIVIFPPDTARNVGIADRELAYFSQAEARVGDPVTIAGYGLHDIDHPETSETVLRIGHNQIDRVSDGIISFRGTRNPNGPQNDASVAPGDSGSSLFDSQNKIIGVTSAVGDERASLQSNFASVHSPYLGSIFAAGVLCMPTPCAEAKAFESLGISLNESQKFQVNHAPKVIYRHSPGSRITGYTENSRYRFFTTEHVLYRVDKSTQVPKVVWDLRSNPETSTGSYIVDVQANDEWLYLLSDNELLISRDQGQTLKGVAQIGVGKSGAEWRKNSWIFTSAQFLKDRVLISTNAAIFEAPYGSAGFKPVFVGTGEDLFIKSAMRVGSDIWFITPENLYHLTEGSKEAKNVYSMFSDEGQAVGLAYFSPKQTSPTNPLGYSVIVVTKKLVLLYDGPNLGMRSLGSVPGIQDNSITGVFLDGTNHDVAISTHNKIYTIALDLGQRVGFQAQELWSLPESGSIRSIVASKKSIAFNFGNISYISDDGGITFKTSPQSFGNVSHYAAGSFDGDKIAFIVGKPVSGVANFPLVMDGAFDPESLYALSKDIYSVAARNSLLVFQISGRSRTLLEQKSFAGNDVISSLHVNSDASLVAVGFGDRVGISTDLGKNFGYVSLNGQQGPVTGLAFYQDKLLASIPNAVIVIDLQTKKVPMVKYSWSAFSISGLAVQGDDLILSSTTTVWRGPLKVFGL